MKFSAQNSAIASIPVSVIASVAAVTLITLLAQKPLDTSEDQSQTHLPSIDPGLEVLPKWVTGTPHDFALEMYKGSKGLTDKVNHRHLFQYLYQPNLASLVTQKMSSLSPPKIRMLEIGLGCHPTGGMINGKPGGSAFGWKHLFDQVPDIEFQLYVFEYDEKCATKWYESNPHTVVKVLTGDASSEQDLNRAYEEAGGEPFDVIIDDASHINWHQIISLDWGVPKVAAGGFFVVEDIQSACHGWTSNMGTHSGEDVGGSGNCMTTSDGKETILARLMEYQRCLIGQRDPYFAEKKKILHGVSRIEIHTNIALLSKEVMSGV